jgi:hypothetical protein
MGVNCKGFLLARTFSFTIYSLWNKEKEFNKILVHALSEPARWDHGKNPNFHLNYF